MINIAIVEDEDGAAATLEGYIKQYGKDKNIDFGITRFPNAVVFIEGYKAGFDLIFMDIRMPYMSGMDAAKLLRKNDPLVPIIFITSLAQYAIEGYSVNAIDYIIKPIEYNEFVLKFTRALGRMKLSDMKSTLVRTKDGIIKVRVSEIRYLESLNHNVAYHMGGGKTHVCRSSLTAAEAALGDDFVRCNSCYTVNLAFVQQVKGFTVTVDGEELTISQPRKKKFMQALEDFTKK